MQAWEQENNWLLPMSGLLQQKLSSRHRLPHCFFASASVISVAGACVGGSVGTAVGAGVGAGIGAGVGAGVGASAHLYWAKYA